MARTGGQRAAALLEEALDDAVFEAVESDDGQPAARTEHSLGGAQPLLQLLELGVHMDADRLECAGSRIAFLPLAIPQCLADDRRELRGASQRPGGYDGACAGPGARFFPRLTHDPGDGGLIR